MPTRPLPDPILPSRTVTAPTGQITIGQTTYSFPIVDGQSGQALVTSGSGQLAWQYPSGTGASFDTPILIGSSLSFKPTDVYTDYTITAGDVFIRYRGTATAVITAPAAVTVRQLLIENQSDVPLTVRAATGDTIDGDTDDITLDARFASASMMSDGLGNWLLI